MSLIYLIMVKRFIDQVRKIVINNIDDENFGVKKLASLIGLSTSQTLKKIKAITNKSVNQYIRELRLEEAATLIKETDFTISEIAFKVGFSSQSYFNKVFRKYFGITPGEYKIKSKDIDETKHKSELNLKLLKSKKAIFYSIIIVLLLGIGFVLLNQSQVKKRPNERPTLAVLPFKNFSKEKENQYLANGLWDDLLNHLSALKGLVVISRQSTERYRSSKKSMTKIGKELGATYVLESSIQKGDNELKVITQLIETKSDKHIGSYEYKIDLKNIFKKQCEIAKLITQELDIILTDKEEKSFAKHSTENMEAYYLFLKARLKNNSRKKEDLELNIKLNKQAVALDPNYADAYAEIGNSYYLMGVYSYISRTEANNKGYFYTDKALDIDPNCFRANAVRAMLLWYIDWAKAKKYHKKAIALNPNDAAAHLQYGRYFLFISNPDIKKFLYHLRIGQRLDPFSRVVGGNFLNALLMNDKILEAEQYQNKMGFLWSKEVDLSRKAKVRAYKNKDRTEVIRVFETEIKKDSNNIILNTLLAAAYDEILNDDINAIKYFKRAYELDSTNARNARSYVFLLTEGKQFAAAYKIMQSKNFKLINNRIRQLEILWTYYYHQEKYKKAQEVLTDSLVVNVNYYKALTFAQLGDKKRVKILIEDKKHFLGNSKRAFIYAILKEKDSMYHYLEKAFFNFSMKGPNSRREFDPYRKEERYIAILKKNHLPITHWNK